MMLVIEKNEVEKLAKKISKKHLVISPAKKENGETVFEKISPESKLSFEYKTTVLSIKQFFFPAEEETFAFNKTKGKLLPAKKEKETIIFGLNLRDTEALVQMDEIMKKPNEDFFYFQKRNKATIVSVVNEKGHLPHIGIDLILERINENEYKALALTKKGQAITKNNYFKEKKINPNSGNAQKDEISALQKLLIDPELLKDAVAWSWKNYSKIWEELGEKCLGCGICTYVCPLCHCFSTEDTCDLTGKKCSKTRKWTACTLPEFAKITGGHDFHPTTKERYYNWFYHKFVRAYNEYGKSQCVACGRCKEFCPAGIDIEKVLTEIVSAYTNKN